MKVLSASLLLSVFAAMTSVAAPRVENLPPSFYDRPGLKDMPRIDYASMKVVSVRDMGAVGDGIQNDRPAFDKAIEALRPEGGVIFVPKGRYFFAEPVLPERKTWNPSLPGKSLDNIHIVGEGDESIISFQHTPPPLDKKTLFYGWSIAALSNGSIRDLRFSVEPVFDQRWEPGVGINPLAFSGAKNVQVLRVRIDQGRMGIVFWAGNKDVWLVGCHVRNTGADGIHFENSTHIVAAYNWVENSGDDGIAMIGVDKAGVVKTPTIDTQFLYNTVKGVRWGRGIVISGEDAIVKGNWVEGASFAGVYVQSRGAGDPGPAIVGAVVRDNTLIRNTLSVRPDSNLQGHEMIGGVRLGLHVVSAIVEGNRIFANQGDGIQLGGVEELRSDNIEIRNNVIESNLGAGIGIRLRTPPGSKPGSKWVSGGFPPDSRIERLLIAGNTFAANRDGAIISKTPGVISLEPADAMNASQSDKGMFDPYLLPRTAASESKWDLLESVSADGLAKASVRDFGAKGDGLADDQEAFARALDSLPPEGGLLQIPAGTYRITPKAGRDSSPETCVRHHLQIAQKKNVHLLGEGDSTVLLFTGPDHQGLRFLACENVSIKNLRMKLENTPGSRRNRALLDIAASSAVWLEGVAVSRSSGPGILLDNSRQVTVKQCRIEAAGTDGIGISASRQILIEDSTLKDSRDQGIRITWTGGGVNRSPQFIRLIKNEIAGTSSGSGIAINSGNEIDVIENTVSSTALSGISVYEQARVFSPQKMRIERNTLANCPDQRWASYTLGAVSVWNLKSVQPRGELTITENHFEAGVDVPIWISLTGSRINALGVDGNTNAAGSLVEPRFDPVEQKGNIKVLTLASTDAPPAAPQQKTP